MNLRQANSADIPAIVALINQAFRVERFLFDGDRIDEPQVRALFDVGKFLLVEMEGRLAGVVYVELRGKGGYLGLLSVDPSHQRGGIGGELMNAAEEFFRANGCSRVDLQLVSLRTELPPYYRKFGFVECGIAPFPSEVKAKQPCHFILMSKSLEQ
ncbi:MAG TPA: GNAT family N-acetyltransferase [Blastocatellia bacterium]|nr:GNAT family N-acetyltransferase [Blastocatellia bacterium]